MLEVPPTGAAAEYGIDDDEGWKTCVAKMRRQPSSGISADDSVAILRYLHVFSLDLRREKASQLVPSEALRPDPDAAARSGTR